MKHLILFFSLLVCIFITHAQVGIGTTNPEGALDISSPSMGVVVPRVASIETAVDASGNDAVNGTILFDQSRNKICFRVNDSWVCNGVDASGNATTEVVRPLETANMTYVKASNTTPLANFGYASSLSDNGQYLVVGAHKERSNATGINGDQNNISFTDAGAAYVFFYDGTNWAQQAYIKASNTAVNDVFGIAVSINNDGSRIVVGASGEDSNATGVNGNQADNSSSGSGAGYVFSRSGTTWSQEAYLKASNTETYDSFGGSVAISHDGFRVAVGASQEDSNATGINGVETDNSVSNSGAVYIFSRTGTTWSQEAYIKASNTDPSDRFGSMLRLDNTGSRLATVALYEQSNATGINGDQTNNAMSQAGAAYVFSRSGSTWTQEAYIKASNTDASDVFGSSISISNDGSKLVVAAYGEDSNATGINGNQADNSALTSGAAYVFTRTGTVWSQQAYIKASNADNSDQFGYCVAMSADGATIVVIAPTEDSNARGIDGDQANNSCANSGAAYVFTEAGALWSQTSYIKASNADTGDQFGNSVSLNTDGTRIVVGTRNEDSNATGINGDLDDNSYNNPGAVYIIEN